MRIPNHSMKLTTLLLGLLLLFLTAVSGGCDHQHADHEQHHSHHPHQRHDEERFQHLTESRRVLMEEDLNTTLSPPPSCTARSPLDSFKKRMSIAGKKYQFATGEFVSATDYYGWNWPRVNEKVVVPYRFNSSYPFFANETAYIVRSLKELEDLLGVVEFVPQTFEANYIDIVREVGCYSDSIGRLGGPQELSLGDSCISTAIIHPRVFACSGSHGQGDHYIGYYHEHVRPDRDDFVFADLKNIEVINLHNFIIENITDNPVLSIPYAYTSVMHYGSDYFSLNGNDNLIPLIPSVAIGNQARAGLSDIWAVRLVYQCESGPRALPEYLAQPCSVDCKCWEGVSGCGTSDDACLRDLVCRNDQCVKPGAALPVPSCESSACYNRGCDNVSKALTPECSVAFHLHCENVCDGCIGIVQGTTTDDSFSILCTAPGVLADRMVDDSYKISCAEEGAATCVELLGFNCRKRIYAGNIGIPYGKTVEALETSFACSVAQSIEYVGISELTALHPGCNDPSKAQDIECRTAIFQYCARNGLGVGGIAQNITASDVEVACLGDYLTPSVRTVLPVTTSSPVSTSAPILNPIAVPTSRPIPPPTATPPPNLLVQPTLAPTSRPMEVCGTTASFCTVDANCCNPGHQHVCSGFKCKKCSAAGKKCKSNSKCCSGKCKIKRFARKGKCKK